jgi:hypothetical protein
MGQVRILTALKKDMFMIFLWKQNIKVYLKGYLSQDSLKKPEGVDPDPDMQSWL